MEELITNFFNFFFFSWLKKNFTLHYGIQYVYVIPIENGMIKKAASIMS